MNEWMKMLAFLWIDTISICSHNCESTRGSANEKINNKTWTMRMRLNCFRGLFVVVVVVSYSVHFHSSTTGIAFTGLIASLHLFKRQLIASHRFNYMLWIGQQNDWRNNYRIWMMCIALVVVVQFSIQKVKCCG